MLIEFCPVCSGGNTLEFLRRDNVPVHQNLPFSSQSSALQIPRGTLAMRICRDCSFVWNAAFDPKLLCYGEQYENAQWHSAAFLEYMHSLAHHLLVDEGITKTRIVEIGCGQGNFLRMLVERPELENSGIGFDPSYVGLMEDLGGKLKFFPEYYGATKKAKNIGVAICRHVIEHIQEPVGLLRTIKTNSASAHSFRLFVETPCVSWILRNRVLWDFFYEHCSLFTSNSIMVALTRAGFGRGKVHHVFGDQYLFVRAQRNLNEKCNTPSRESVTELVRSAEMLGDHERTTIASWRSLAEKLSVRGGIALWGAGAKGVTLANLFDPCRDNLLCLIDINPRKQDKYAPGTGHPIVSIQKASSLGVRTAVVMNPNYLSECARMVESAGVAMKLVTNPLEAQ